MIILMRNRSEKDWKIAETTAYGKEDELQHLLAETPSLISISEIREGAGPLVAAVREFNLPIGFIDLLAFSAKGDIAVIECKLASSSEAKRKVIGQVLEYGANLWQMSYAELDQGVLIRSGKSLVELVEPNVEPTDWDEEAFRDNIASNLANGDFILVIVVDEINDELSRIVRYMNLGGSQGFDFAALEMRRFHSGDSEMLIPRFYGPSHSSANTASGKTTRQWDEASFFSDLGQRNGEEVVSVARRLLEWSKKVGSIWWGKGLRDGSFVPTFLHKEIGYFPFAVYTYGRVEVYFQWLKYRPVFDRVSERKELLNKLNAIEGVSISEDGIDRRPSIKLVDLAVGDRLEQFLAVFDWVVSEIKKT